MFVFPFSRVAFDAPARAVLVLQVLFWVTFIAAWPLSALLIYLCYMCGTVYNHEGCSYIAISWICALVITGFAFLFWIILYYAQSVKQRLR